MGMCVATLLAMPATASAQVTFTPTRFDDPLVGPCLPTDCSLREAVDEPTRAEPRRIVLKPGRYELTQGAPLRLDNNAGETIQGAGARLTTIDANFASQVIVAVEGNDLAVVNDVTITGGNAATSPGGGGIEVQVAASLALNRSAVFGNQSPGAGGGIYTDRNLTVTDSTISGNQAGSAQLGGNGAGIYSTVGGNVTLTNTTVSANFFAADASASNGGGIFSGGALQLTNVTVAGNAATNGALYQGANGAATLWNSIITAATGTACAGSPPLIGGDHNLDDDGTCQFGAAGDKPGVNPLLGGLANNGGPTDTRLPAVNSPTVNAGTAAHCPGADQRAVPRPQLGVCDMGAVEFRLPLLRVIKRVVNDDKGIEAADDFTVHVRVGAADVAGSPAPGSAGGRTYTLTPGSYSVGEDASEVYAASFAGDCSASGVVVLGEGQSKSCTITNDDKAPGLRVFNVEPKRGTVRIKLPGRKRFRRLTEGEQLPVGTTVDTRKGRVTIIAASNKKGGTSRADFYDGIFKLGQTRGRRPISTLTLVEKLTGCKAAGKQASAAAKKKRRRRLWGDGKGRFRTRGTHSAATVVGTKWLVEDRCTSTLTRVARGRVKVTDFEKHKSVFVRKGHRYIARAQ
jgi:hypothetical protein